MLLFPKSKEECVRPTKKLKSSVCHWLSSELRNHYPPSSSQLYSNFFALFAHYSHSTIVTSLSSPKRNVKKGVGEANAGSVTISCLQKAPSKFCRLSFHIAREYRYMKSSFYGFCITQSFKGFLEHYWPKVTCNY